MTNSITIEDDNATPAENESAQPDAAREPAEQATGQNATAETTPKEEKAKRGTTYLDFASLPKEIAEVIEPRFKRLYANLKAVERDRDTQFQINQKLAEQMEDLSSKIQKTETDSVLDRLRSEYQQAMMSADYAKAGDLMERITDHKAGLKPVARVEIPVPTHNQVDLAPAEQRAVLAWQAATDENGQPLRPWANPAHPKFQSVMKLIGSIVDDPDFSGSGIGNILQEADRRLSGTAPAARQSATVLTSQPDAASRAPRAIPLSDQEKRVALRMFRDTGLSKTEDEAYNRYRSAKANTSRAVTVDD